VIGYIACSAPANSFEFAFAWPMLMMLAYVWRRTCDPGTGAAVDVASALSASPLRDRVADS
jgi:hypothetical protein